MNIEFVKQGNAYVAEFKVEADFNLHIERDKKGHITLLQRTSEGGKYALLEEFGYQDGKTVYESDAAGLIYPKFIKVVSAVMPTYAVVTSAGEVTEIKSQTKEIEVTANGTTEVTPDAGFAYLNSVKVKTNVAGSGEGGGSDEWIVAMINTEDTTIPIGVGTMIAALGGPMFFPKGNSLQIVAGMNFISTITPMEEVSSAYKDTHAVGGAALKRGATMNDVGDGKVRTVNNEEDYKNLVFELCLLSGYDVTMADVEAGVKFFSQNELMSIIANA